MSGITLTPVAAAVASASSGVDLAGGGVSGFGDALGAALSQLANHAAAESLPLQDMPAEVAIVADTATEPESTGSSAPSLDAFGQLMLAMGQYVALQVGGRAAEAADAAVEGTDLSASNRAAGGKVGVLLQGAQWLTKNTLHDAAEAEPPLAALDRLLGADGGTHPAGENFAALMQDLPLRGVVASEDQGFVWPERVVDPQGTAAPVSQGSVIEIRHQEGRKEVVIATPVTADGWGDELGSKTLILVKDGIQSADMQLNPPNLGPLEVRLSVENDQTSLVFVSAHASVREAIQTALPRLSGMLAESGLSMGSVLVGDQSLAQQQQQQHSQPQRRSASAFAAEADGALPSNEALPLGRSSWRLSMFV